MALSMVVDTSGSMSGTKIEQARRAAIELLETARNGDVVSVYGFESRVFEHAPPTLITPASRQTLVRAIEAIEVGGSTAMFDGLAAGIAALIRATSEHPLRRVFLISDGHANVGPQSTQELGALAASGMNHDVHVTGIGVGMDYDAATVGEIVVRSAGRFYHLAEPAQLAGIVAEEIGALSDTVATNSVVEFVPAQGVQILEAVTEGSQITGDRFRIALGSLYPEREVELLLRVRVPTQGTGHRPLGTLRLHFETPDARRTTQTQERQLVYTLDTNPRAVAGSVSARAFTIAHTQTALRESQRAMDSLEAGDTATAAAALDNAARDLDQAARRAPSPAARQRLQARADTYRSQSRSAVQASSPSARRDAGATIRVNAYRDSAY